MSSINADAKASAPVVYQRRRGLDLDRPKNDDDPLDVARIVMRSVPDAHGATIFTRLVLPSLIRDLFWRDDEARDILVFQSFVRNVSTRSEHLLLEVDRSRIDDNKSPRMTREMVHTICCILGQMTEMKVRDMSKKRIEIRDFNLDAIFAYTGTTTRSQRTTWHCIKDSFYPLSINERLEANRFIAEFSAFELQVNAISLTVNKYLYRLPYEKPFAKMSDWIYKWSPDRSSLDPILNDMRSYTENLEQLTAWARRTALCTFARHVYMNPPHAFIVDIPGDDMTSVDDRYYSHGARVYFDAEMNCLGSNLSDKAPLNRILSSFMTFATWSVHFGVVHAEVADRWNYLFFQHVGDRHELAPLVIPLTLGASHALNIGSMLLANRVPSAISAIVSNITPSSVERLARRYVTNISDIKSRLHFPTMVALMGIDLCNVDLPTINTLREWRDTKSDLACALTMMHFNNVVHQLYSNDQHTADAMATKHAWVCHKEHVNPSYFVQDRLIELLIGTSGDSLHYDESMF
ncbi:hypothetical protein CYMTET_37685 [Cymbomonas tetramitiformis]|uniref:Uncharacterized protein n=1 Tax=Cymbomonas tetramitiformis TaxID=36881 RepID=A0AAE0F7C7_9CHLO|nr:hypothetical protein CYMTET_37685 [Cymbomonas tetramitiformis]